MIVENLRDGYLELAQHVLRVGAKVSPRGYETREIQDFQFMLTDPTDALPLGVGRKPNLAIGAAEALQLCGGMSDPTMMVSIAKNFSRFLDGGVLHGAYGPRVRPQLPRVANRLVLDRDTRQAIIQVWDPLYDLEDARDLPCTLGFGFRIRDDKLNMSAVMRSNDVWLGTAYDVFMFTQLQCTVANALGLEVGTYTHHAYSFHVYARDYDKVEALHAYEAHPLRRDPYEPLFKPSGFGFKFQGAPEEWDPGVMEYVMLRARQVHTGDWIAAETATERWYRDVLSPYDRLVQTANFEK